MTRVDFYVMDNPNARQHDMLVCRLAEKAWRAGHAVYLRCQGPENLAEIDDLLWTFKDTAFVPHAPAADPAVDTVPVTLGHGDETPPSNDVLINLGDSVPTFFSRFERVMETTGADERSRIAARDRYRYYQERGYTLNTHRLGSQRG